MNAMMTFEQLDKQRYRVIYDNGVIIGDLDMDGDGYFYFWPERLNGAWEAHVLRAIADKLDEINKPWDEEIARAFQR